MAVSNNMTRNLKINPTKRFSNRVEYYIKCRPKYPQAIIEVLKKECSLENSSVIADIGSGTGFLSELFLRNKNSVFAVEPNKEMREAAEKLIPKGSNFVSVNGSAEATTLDSHSIDFITAGQAFHWFDVEKSRSEFARILKPECVEFMLNGLREKDVRYKMREEPSHGVVLKYLFLTLFFCIHNIIRSTRIYLRA